jgi:hypothetical protein
MNTNLALEAFDQLVVVYPFHPVLWTLYAVNRRLAVRKPELDKSVEIFNYHPVTNPWLGGVTNSIRDVIAIDDSTEKECWYACATIRDRGDTAMYWIPREWIKRIIVNERKNFVLLPFEFCCRQILKRTDCKLARCQSHIIPSKFFVDQYYFHVGCGPCHKEISTVIADFQMFIGIKQLTLMLEDESVTKHAEHLLCLLVADDEISVFKLEKVQKDNTKEFCDVIPSYIRCILKHILMCKKCNVNLKTFLGVLERCVTGTKPFNDYDDVIACEFYYNDKIPCDKYVIDDEFDEMRNAAYKAIDSSLNDDSLHEVVDKFIETYCA